MPVHAACNRSKAERPGEIAMKKILLIAALATIALVQAQPSEAYFRGNWCAKIDKGGGAVSERCDFPTFATCRSYIVGESRSFCVQNQWQGGHWGVSDDRSEHYFNRRYR
jgi:hypothetical protein